MLQKLSPTNKITVEQFFQQLKSHKDVWSTVSGMGIVDFADTLNGARRLREMARSQKEAPGGEGRRTRLSEQQKQSLKGLVQRILNDDKGGGMTRNQIAEGIAADQIKGLGIQREELANKLRQPLGELVKENKIHTTGEKRLMRYHAGSGQGGGKNKKG